MRREEWAVTAEIKRALADSNHGEFAGPVLYANHGKTWVYNKEGHTIYLGVSGSGKTRSGILLMIMSYIKAGESFIVIDPKGEIYRNTAPYLGDDYDLHVIDFRHILKSERWNPLASTTELYKAGTPENEQRALEQIDELSNVMYSLESDNDKFWPLSARSLFRGIVTALLELKLYDQMTMANLYKIVAEGDERLGTSTYLKELVALLPPSSPAAMQLHSYTTTANDTKAGIRSFFLEGIALFTRTKGMISMFSDDDLQINHLSGDKSTAIYIIVPDESPIFDSLAGNLCNQLLNHYMHMAQEVYDGVLPKRLNVVLEELGNIGGAIPSLPHLMSAGRSRNIRCQLVLQSLSQLETIYKKSEADTIRANADIIVAFRTNQWDTLVELSNKCGEYTRKTSSGVLHEKRISPAQLAAMKTGQALIMISGRVKYVTNLPDFSQLYGEKPPMDALPVTKRGKDVDHTFDLKEYVKRKKREAMERKSTGVSSEHITEELPFDTTTPPGDGIPSFEEFMASRERQRREEAMKKAGQKVSEDKKQAQEKKEADETSKSGDASDEVSTPRHALHDFDIDRLIADIDRKIAELEAEEKAQQEKKEAKERAMQVAAAAAAKPKATPKPATTKPSAVAKPTAVKPQTSPNKPNESSKEDDDK